MPDYLALADWTKELKKHGDAKDVRDVERLLKELGQHQKAEDAAGQRQTLAALVEEAKGVKKKNAKLDGLADYLDEIAEAATKELKQVEARGGSEDDEDDEGAALAVLIPRVRKRSAEKAYNFVLALGKPSGLVMTKRTLNAGHTKQAKDLREGQGKIVEGRCYGEGAVHIFEIAEAPPRGMAKKIKLTVLAKSELKIKVKVRGGGVELDDDTDVDDDEAQTAPASTAAPTAGSVAYAKLLLAFDGVKKKLHGELANLEKSILGEFEGDAELAEVQQDVRQLDQILQTFDDSLKDLFDDAINVPAGERGRFHTQALAVIDRYQSYLAGDPFVLQIAENPFGVPVSIKLMSETLTTMAKRLT